MGKYEHEFLIDAGKALASVDKLISQEEKLQEALNKSEKKAQESFDKSATAAEKFNRKLGEGILIQQKVKNSTEAFKKEVERLNAVYGELRGQQTKFIAEAKFDEYKKKVKEIEDRITQLGGTLKKTGGADYFKPQLSILDRLKKQADIYKKAIQTATNPELLAKYNRKLEETEATLRKVQNAGKRGFDDVGNKIGGVNGTTQRFMGTLGGLFGALGITFGLSAIVSFGKELFGIAKQAEGIEIAFARIGSQDVLENLRQQTKGTVSDLELMKAAVNADNFKIPMDVLGKGLAFAQQRAKDTGKDVDYLVNSLVDGIGRKSALKIDNLGISLIELQREISKTGDFASAVGNIMEREMARVGESVETLSEKAAKSASRWQNLKNDTAKFFRNMLSPESADTDKVLELTDKIKKSINFEELEKFTRGQVQAWAAAMLQQKVDLEAQAKELEKKQFDVLVAQGKRGNREFTVNRSATQAKIKGINEEILATSNVLVALNKQVKVLEEKERIEKGILNITEMQAQVTKLRTEAEGIFPETDADISRRTRLLKEAAEIQAEIDRIMGKADKKMRAAIDKAAKDRQRALMDAYKALADLNKELEREYQKARLDILDQNSKDYQYEILQQRLAEITVIEESVKAANKKLYGLTNGKAGSKNGALTDKQSEQVGLLKTEAYSKYYEELAKIDQNESERLFELKLDSDEKELEAIKRKYAIQIEEARKAGKEYIAVEAENARERELAAAKTAQALKAIQIRESIAVSEVESDQFITTDVDGLNYEQTKQKAILDIKIKAAKDSLEVLKNSTEAEKELLIKQQNALITGLTDDRNELLEKKGKFDILDLFGIKEENMDEVRQAFSEMISAVSDFANSFIDQQLRMAEVAVEEKDRAIEDKRDQINQELELHKQGFASNVEGTRAEMEILKQEREAALAEQRKQQKLKNALDTASQIQNLITAGTEIFKVTAAFNIVPGVGISIAAGLISAMFALTQSMKSKAAASTKMEKGGLLKGRRHTQGGNKFISLDGSHELEHEEGEFFTNRKSTGKYLDFLEAINADDEAKLTKLAASMLVGTGISGFNSEKRDKPLQVKHIPQSAPELPVNWKAINKVLDNNKKVKESEAGRSANADLKGELAALNEKVSKLVTEAKKPKTQYLPDRKITQSGNYTKETIRRKI